MIATSVTVSRIIQAPAGAIFALLADPSRHPDFDGSGTVRAARREGRRVDLGDSFGMEMHWGVGYSTLNRIVEFEPDRRIAWRTLASGPLRHLLGGRTWRYVLEPVEGGTRVTETWDTATEVLPSRLALRRLAGLTRTNMTRTLERLARVVEP